MKRFAVLITAIILAVSVLSGCVENSAENNMQSTAVQTAENKTEALSNIDNTESASPLIYCEFTVENKWQSDDGKYTQLKVTVCNDADFDIDSWSASANAQSGLTVTDKWGIECNVKSGTLYISPAHYTKHITAKSKCDNMGLIVRASEYLSDFSGKIDSVSANVSQDVIQAALSGNKSSAASTTTALTSAISGAKTAENTRNSGTSKESKQNSTNSKTAVAPKTTSAAKTAAKQSSPPKNESGTPLANHGKLSVNGTRLVDKNGKSYQLKGVSTHGIAWYPQYVSKAAFKTLRDDWGANMIRLAMYTAEYNGYCSGGDKNELESLVNSGVKACTELGMYAIIDWHILSDGNPNQNKSAAKSFFRKMAQKYQSYNNVIYEICNEPNGGTTWSQIKSYADDIIAVIREYDKDAIIIVGTPTWSQNVEQAAKNPVKNGKNVMYAVHFYAATHKQWLRDKVKSAINSGAPVFVSEFSICDSSGNGSIDYTEANKWKSFINDNNLSYAGWSLSNKAETSALIKSGCNKTSGWSKSDLSDTGKWLRSMIKG